MLGKIDTSKELEESDDEEVLHSESIQWINLIFLPFNPCFQKLVIIVVIVKTILGPIQCVYPIVHCWNTLELHPILYGMKFFYVYFCDMIYGIDTFLHILHRQIVDQVLRREHLPKPAVLLLLDIISLIPLRHLLTDDICPPVKLWPNLIFLSEFVIIYRIADYYSVMTSHSYKTLIIGYTFLMLLIVNCLTSIHILLTYYGLCKRCSRDVIFDWRLAVLDKLYDTDISYSTYFYAATATISHLCLVYIGVGDPYTIAEIFLCSLTLLIGYFVYIFVVIAKLFAETLYRDRKRWLFYIKLSQILKETKRRNPSSNAYNDVQKFFLLTWKRRSGINAIPHVITQFPRYLRINIKEDLVWPIFFHSSILRRTSESFKRWLYESVQTDYKLPGETFYSGPHSHTHLYYLKSGVVQIISSDDGTTPLISLTNGTILGDISFILQNEKINRNVRCLTYCEVLYITRVEMLNSIHKYPKDRFTIMEHVRDRLKHARILKSSKEYVLRSDRSEDEGIAWLKRRWWKMSEAFEKWSKKNQERRQLLKFEIPTEESIYHCAKYIGQLVLCDDAKIHSQSVFANFKFPWFFVSESVFQLIWSYVVYVTVLLALILYPPIISRVEIPNWFFLLEFWIDLVFSADICISLLTYEIKYDDVSHDFAAIVFKHCKTLKFALDFSSSVWIERVLYVCGVRKHYYAYKFNRLIKIYVLFIDSDIQNNPLYDAVFKVVLKIFSFFYVSTSFFFYLVKHNPNLDIYYFFGFNICEEYDIEGSPCYIETISYRSLLKGFVTEFLVRTISPETKYQVVCCLCLYYSAFIFLFHCKMKVLSSFYFTSKNIVNYQNYIFNVCQLYKHQNIHPNLLKRLNRYLICHWQNNKGMDETYPHLLKNEPYDIYLKVQGNVAEEVIKQSILFKSADQGLIKELACKAKFFLLPKNAILNLFGHPFTAVTWLVQGYILCEYPDKDDELVHKMHGPGDMLTTLTGLSGSVGITSHTAYTDCEVLYINNKEFFDTFKQYPREWKSFDSCIEEFRERIEVSIQNKVQGYKNYQKKLRLRVFHGNMMFKHIDPIKNRLKYCISPESRFIKYWILFRAVVVVISIVNASVQGHSFSSINRYPYKIIEYACDGIGIIDILLKFFVGYYNEQGILITSACMRLKHYLARGFLIDFIGCLPIHIFIQSMMFINIEDCYCLLINSVTKYAHLYLLTGYFNYMADLPNVNYAVTMIVKCHLILLFCWITSAQFLMHQCILVTWDSSHRAVNVTLREGCWLHIGAPGISYEFWNFISVLSLYLVQNGFVGKRQVGVALKNLGFGGVIYLFPIMFWLFFSYVLALIVLNFYRENTLFQHGVDQLEKFLKAERVDQKLTMKSTAHFKYWWLRNKGTNMNLIYESIGDIFQQDLCTFFYKKSVKPFSDFVNGGEVLQRELSSTATLMYFLPSEVILREMSLNPYVYIIHRGKILIKRGNKRLNVLSKGSIFGQLDGNLPSPIHITAIADEHTDLLQISIQDFQYSMEHLTKKTVTNSTGLGVDYIMFKDVVKENPYNSIRYLIRENRRIKFPWMYTAVSADSSKRIIIWLYIIWVVGPLMSYTLALLACSFPTHVIYYLIWILWAMDVLHVAHVFSSYFTTQLLVINEECVVRVLKWRIIKEWRFYLDMITIIFPLFPIGQWKYFCRTLRLHLLYDFHVTFCKGFRSYIAWVILNYIIVFLVFHGIACLFIITTCRDEGQELQLTTFTNLTVDFDEWAYVGTRPGCVWVVDFKHKTDKARVVSRNWSADYIIAISFVVTMLTHYDLARVGLTGYPAKAITFGIVSGLILYCLSLWLFSLAITVIYTRFRELYIYDYSVANVNRYLSISGLCPALLKSVKEYTMQLWKRQRGNWLPEFVQKAPLCLREDLFSALYIYHLQLVPVFNRLPMYFLQQLVTRVHRVVVFPEKCIVQEGDIYPRIFFIHEGEVEKWYTDKDGEKKLMTVLTTNGYFGLMCGLFPSKPFHFSYVTRTVVDLIYLKHKDLENLLCSYPDVRRKLYEDVKQ